MHVYYTIEYKSERKYWVLWKNIKFEKGTNFYGVYHGTKFECKKELERIKEKERIENERIKRRNKIIK